MISARGRVALLVLSWILAAGVAANSASTEIVNRLAEGQTVENVALPTIDGEVGNLLGEDESVNVFVFFKPRQEHSRTLLMDLSCLVREFGDAPVHWAAVVSDRFDAVESADLFAALELEVPVLVTAEDSLFGALGVALLPIVGVTDHDDVLRAYLPYRKVNYAATIAAHVRHVLGEITDDELGQALSPPAVVQGGRKLEAQRCLHLAQRLLAAGHSEMALARALGSLQRDSTLVEAHDFVGNIYLSRGEFTAATLAFERALDLSPDDSTASAGLSACRRKP